MPNPQIDETIQLQIIDSYKKLRPDFNNRQDVCRIIAASVGVSESSVKKYAPRDLPPIIIEPPVVHKVDLPYQTSADYEILELPPIKQFSRGIEINPDEKLVTLLGSDFHFPYENPSAVALFYQVAEDVQPDVIVLLGDVMDCYAVSAHDKDADRATPATFKAEIDYTRNKLTEIRAVCPNSRIIFKEGNHETRLSRYINKNAAILSKLKCVTLPSLLGLDELKIEWLAENQRLRIGKLYFIHGHEVGGSGASPARAKYSRMLCNFIFGHLHTEDKHRARAYDGSQQGAWCNPCLCDLEPEYLHHSVSWSNGFSFINFEADGTFQLDQINIIQETGKSKEARCRVIGKRYEVNI